MSLISHAYHIYADGPDWYSPIYTHHAALFESGLLEEIDHTILGIVGTERNRKAVHRSLRSMGWKPDEVIETLHGWEQVTMTALWEHARAYPAGCSLYAHTKGASDPTLFNGRWRRAMTRVVVGRWREAVEQLQSGFDAAGPFFLTSTSPEHAGLKFYGGNFFWVKNSTAAKLPAPNNSSRWEAEVWLNGIQMSYYDMFPGFPSDELFGQVLSG